MVNVYVLVAGFDSHARPPKDSMRNVFETPTNKDLTQAVLKVKEAREDSESYDNYQDYLDKNAAVEIKPK